MPMSDKQREIVSRKQKLYHANAKHAIERLAEIEKEMEQRIQSGIRESNILLVTQLIIEDDHEGSGQEREKMTDRVVNAIKEYLENADPEQIAEWYVEWCCPAGTETAEEE